MATNKWNVCLINDSFPPAIDGVANAVVNYGRIISEKLGKASVVTPFYPDADDSVFPFPVLRYPSLDVTKLVGYRAGMPFSPALMQQLEDSRFDIIHSHCPIASTMVARYLRERIDAPVVFTYHTKFDIDIANAVRGKLLQDEAARLLVENISACDEVWTVSKGAGDNLRKLGYEGAYRVMPNGVDFPQGHVDDALIEQVTGGYDLPAGLPLFLFVGRMMWYKGIRIILDALARLAAAGKDFRMVFLGGGNDKDEIMAYTASLGLTGRVFFLEPIRDREKIRAWYCRADLFLFPSTFDTNGLVVREAAACSLASVLVAGSCAAEDVKDGETGFLIEENAESLAKKLEQLLPRFGKVRQVGEQAQQEIYISWETAVSNAYARYGDVIEKYRCGGYPVHDGPTDDFFHGIAKAMATVNRTRIAQQQLISDVRSGYEELRSGIQGILDSYDELWSGLVEKHSETINGLEQQLKDLYQRTDRFL